MFSNVTVRSSRPKQRETSSQKANWPALKQLQKFELGQKRSFGSCFQSKSHLILFTLTISLYLPQWNAERMRVVITVFLSGFNPPFFFSFFGKVLGLWKHSVRKVMNNHPKCAFRQKICNDGCPTPFFLSELSSSSEISVHFRVHQVQNFSLQESSWQLCFHCCL